MDSTDDGCGCECWPEDWVEESLRKVGKSAAVEDMVVGDSQPLETYRNNNPGGAEAEPRVDGRPGKRCLWSSLLRSCFSFL